ncbi:coiled-coil domain-containing protein 126 isoform X1 [Marmota flaviventris]|uniref:coiled-coil domain-containing protein 126 isoform X1 n=2 Tax=Euarchontoglires TaxID=314146 RepID=UPI003A8C3D04
MFFTISRKNMSQKLSLLLLVFGLIWGLMLLHYTFQQPRHQSSVKLREQILDLSKRYVKALAEENKNTVDVENGASMAGYGSKCSGFHSSFTCACGQPAYAHDTVVETKQERMAQGKPVGRDVPYAAMGGLTGFSSLVEGYMRLDDSGIGAPSVEFLNSPVTAMDHAFLKALQGPSTSSPETLTNGKNGKGS